MNWCALLRPGCHLLLLPPSARIDVLPQGIPCTLLLSSVAPATFLGSDYLLMLWRLLLPSATARPGSTALHGSTTTPSTA